MIGKQIPAGSVGLGLRIPHINEVLKTQPNTPWFEIHSCNYLGGGLNRALLSAIADQYPLSFHGVSLNLAGPDPLNKEYLGRLKDLVDEHQPALISEHACMTALHGENLHDLIPVPYTFYGARHLADRVDQVQQHLGRQILLENLSRYASYPESDMDEADFLTEVVSASGCGLLLDLNNAYVNQINLGESTSGFLAKLPAAAIQEIHLAGHTRQTLPDGRTRLIDTHGENICPAVWSLYQEVISNYPGALTLIERDNNLPSFMELDGERQAAESRRRAALSQQGLDIEDFSPPWEQEFVNG
jgi:uncharacterized protein (UPF0276 family)